MLSIDPRRPQWKQVRLVAGAIRRGGLVAIPTDTVYGLAGDPFRPGVVERIFRLKRRAESQRILLLIDSLDGLAPYRLKDGRLPRVIIVPAGFAIRASAGERAGPEAEAPAAARK